MEIAFTDSGKPKMDVPHGPFSYVRVVHNELPSFN